MLIYRVEHKEFRHGPYIIGENYHLKHQDMVDEHNKDKVNHPGIYRDIFKEYLYHTDDYVCGFSSVEDLIDWFDEYIYELQDMGYTIRVVDIPVQRVRFGQKQVVFDKRWGKCVREIIL